MCVREREVLLYDTVAVDHQLLPWSTSRVIAGARRRVPGGPSGGVSCVRVERETPAAVRVEQDGDAKCPQSPTVFKGGSHPSTRAPESTCGSWCLCRGWADGGVRRSLSNPKPHPVGSPPRNNLILSVGDCLVRFYRTVWGTNRSKDWSPVVP